MHVWVCICVKVRTTLYQNQCVNLFFYSENVCNACFKWLRWTKKLKCVFTVWQAHKLLHIKMYTKSHIVQLDEKSKRKTLATALMVDVCRYCFFLYFAASTVIVFSFFSFFIYLFFLSLMLWMFIFPALAFCFDAILIYRDWTVISSFHLKCSHVYRMQNVIINSWNNKKKI